CALLDRRHRADALTVEADLACHRRSAPLLPVDLLLLDALLLERLELLPTGLEQPTLGGLERLLEVGDRLFQGLDRVVGQVERLADGVETPAALTAQEVEELRLQPADVLVRHVVELPGGSAP